MPTCLRSHLAVSRPLTCFVVLASAIALLATTPTSAAEPAAPTALPPPANVQVDFAKHVMPLFARSCVGCHARGEKQGDFSIETKKEFFAGGASGPALTPGNSAESSLIQLVAGMEPDRLMPAKGVKLTPEEIGVLRAWIDQGAVWPDELSFAFPRAKLAPREVKLPAENPGANPIDRLLAPYFANNKVPPAEPIADRVFARRVQMDLLGTLPTPEELDRFERDTVPQKRAMLVAQLLERRRDYAEHWLTFWNDLLRNNYAGAGFIDRGRSQITGWLYKSLYDNKPYDTFVHELINPVEGSDGFVRGIVWRGVVNSSQRPEMQAAQSVGQVFLGTNLKCASCHDSFVSYWRLEDTYALANVFAKEPLESHRCDKPTGKTETPAALFSELGQIPANLPVEQRRRLLADALVSKQNGRLSRTIVNRLWAQLMGHGLIEPLDELDQPSWNADLLDWLANDLVDNGYNLKHTLALICTSDAYQRAAVGYPSGKDEEFVFRGPYVRRLSAEQFVDALGQITGAPKTVTDEMLKFGSWKDKGQFKLISDLVPEVAADEAHREAKLKAAGAKDVSPLGAPVRAALAFEDPLLRAMGRPNREQIVTRRDSLASTLQVLELTNGKTLDELLKAGGKNWLAKAKPEQIPTQVFRVALGRVPTAAELAAAQELLGPKPQAEQVADLLWTVVMLPEFQLIY